MKKAPLVLCVSLACWTLVAAADLTGQWSLDLMPDFGGNDESVGCSFLQDGKNLMLNCGAGPNITARSRGDKSR